MTEAERQTQRLKSIMRYSTAYEVTITNGSRTILAGYTIHKSRHGLLTVLRRNGEAVICIVGEDGKFGKKAAEGMTFGDWKLNFSGRTERESIIAGEHSHIKEVVSPLPGAFK